MDHNWKNYVAALVKLPIDLLWVLLSLLYVTSRICDFLSSEQLIKKCIFARSSLSYDVKVLFDYRNPYCALTYTLVGALVSGVLGWV